MRRILWLAGAGAAAVALDRRIERPSRLQSALGNRFPSGVSGYVSDEPIDEEPADIEYDQRPPCQLPSVLEAFGREGSEDDEGFCVLPADFEPRPSAVPFARGGPRPLWPIQTEDPDKVKTSYYDVRNKFHGKWGRHFGTGRKGKGGVVRRHAGVDLFADAGDVVQAMEDGEIVAILPFTAGTYAIYVKQKSGELVNYGEVERGSWLDFGIQSGIGTGQKISKGQPIAKIGLQEDGAHMLHLETFVGATDIGAIRKGEAQWIKGEPPPPMLLDPTRYLVQAERLWFERQMEPDVT